MSAGKGEELSFSNGRNETGRERHRVPGLQILLIVLPLIVLGFFVPTGVYVERAGDAVPVEGRVTVQGPQTYDNPGELMLTTVSLFPATLLEMTVVLRGGGHLLTEVGLLGPDPDPEHNNELERQAMDQSKQTAAAAALRHLGYDVPVAQEGVLVDAVAAGLPAEGKLQVGDLITAVNGQPLLTAAQLKDFIVAAGIGASLSFHIRRGGEELDISLTTAENPNQPGQAFVGIADEDQVRIDLPFSVQIDTAGIGGPSAGTMMALSIIDVLTPGGITGGKKIAGTGTVDVDGNVGEIGGINLKIEAAEAAGADAFIYPAGNDAEVDRSKSRIPLYPVNTLEEALQAVRAIASS